MNYGVEQIKNFVLSFRKYNLDDDIILIYNEYDIPKIESFIAKHNVRLVSSKELEQIPIHIVASRFFKYLDIVSSDFIREYKHILFADVRDIFFQSNPFKNLPSEDYLFAFTEDPAIKIDKEQHHINMINRMFGSEYITKFSNLRIICSGTIMGTQTTLIEFFREFCDFLFQLHKRNPQVCREMLLDQVIANELFYFGHQKDSVVIKDNGDIVGTIGHCITHPDHSDKLEVINNVFYVNGKIPAVIHQYDRSKQFYDLISGVYSHEN